MLVVPRNWCCVPENSKLKKIRAKPICPWKAEISIQTETHPLDGGGKKTHTHKLTNHHRWHPFQSKSVFIFCQRLHDHSWKSCKHNSRERDGTANFNSISLKDVIGVVQRQVATVEGKPLWPAWRKKIDGGKYRDLAQLSSMKYRSSSPSPPCHPLLPCHFNVFHPHFASPLTCSFPSPFKYRPFPCPPGWFNREDQLQNQIAFGKDVQLFESCDP